jgi:hypothetical protein
MTNYLKAEKAVYRHKHPFRNYRPMTDEEKKSRRELMVAEGTKVSAIMDGKLRGKVKKI